MNWLISDLFPTPLVDRLRSGDEEFVITGATGWFGTVTLDLLDEIYGAETVTRVHAYASHAREVRTRTGRVLPVHALDALAHGVADQVSENRPLLFLHFAFTVPARAVFDGDGARANTASPLVDIVSESLSSLVPAGFCYPSSGAVYGDARSGAIHDYGTQKAADEIAFRERCASVGTKIVIPRVFAVGGPCNPDPRRYLLGELVGLALAGKPMRLRSANRVYRSYISLADVLGLVLTELLGTNRNELIFDACGQEIVEAGELAERVREVLGRPDLPIIRENDNTGSDDRYVGDPTALQALASQWGYDVASLDDVIRQSALA